ncbi:multiple cyclophane-containing RiPP AmcA [Micromonospora sp. S4605]|uniref:multiple cyclophane-containing RiPP AmcA n=1 Tax=Micromonospora sp. S4605 TaxID=1420897 RepID=UPI00406C9E0C
MTLYASRNAADARGSGAKLPAPARRVRAVGRAGIPRNDPPLLTHVWRQIFSEATTEGGRR